MCVHICHLRHPSCLHVSNIQKSFLLTWNILFSATHRYPNKSHNIRSCSFYPVTALHALCVSFLHFPLPSSTSLFYYTIFWTWEQICSCHIWRRTMPCCPTHASAVSAARGLCSIAQLHNPVSLIGHAWEISVGYRRQLLLDQVLKCRRLLDLLILINPWDTNSAVWFLNQIKGPLSSWRRLQTVFFNSPPSLYSYSQSEHSNNFLGGKNVIQAHLEPRVKPR